MSKLATLVVAVAALVLAVVTLSPSSAEAGWHRGWRGAGVGFYAGPRWGWYGPRYRLLLRPLGLPVWVLPLLARPLLARLVLSARAAKASDEIAEGRS